MDASRFLDEDGSDLAYAPGFGPKKKSAAGEETNPTAKVRRRIRVLLVEDNLVDARLVQLSLKHVVDVDFEVLMVTTVTQAVEQLATGGFQLVLLDLGLPDSWGLDTIRKVREYAAAIPIIVLTGNADEELGVQAIHQGAQDYLLKGADAATLMRAIRYAMSRHRMRRKIEKALKIATASEANQRMLIDKNLDGIVVVDGEGLVVHANAAAEVLFAYPAGVLIGQRFPLPISIESAQEKDIVNFECQIVPTELRCDTIEWNPQLVFPRLECHGKSSRARTVGAHRELTLRANLKGSPLELADSRPAGVASSHASSDVSYSVIS